MKSGALYDIFVMAKILKIVGLFRMVVCERWKGIFRKVDVLYPSFGVELSESCFVEVAIEGNWDGSGNGYALLDRMLGLLA